MECKFYPASVYTHPGCDLYIPDFCSLTQCYKIDKVSEADKKRKKFEPKVEEESDIILDIAEEAEAEE
jgi:hypothetical protein